MAVETGSAEPRSPVPCSTSPTLDIRSSLFSRICRISSSLARLTARYGGLPELGFPPMVLGILRCFRNN